MTLGSYELVRRLGAGGMAEVWLARQACFEGFTREVVVKRILPQLADDPRFVKMLFNEARIAARFSHPNIVPIYDFGQAGGTHYLAMEYVKGVDLHELMNRLKATRSSLKPELALRIVAECCKALAYAHQAEGGGVIHRDVSPSNILIGFDGTVKLADFGIAKATDQVSLTQPGMLKGKFSYMSPEQASGHELDPRSDLFSLGLVLFELLTGTRPFKRENELASLRAAIACKVPRPSKYAPVEPELERLVLKALAKDRAQRYRDAREFQLAVERLLVTKQWVASSAHLAREMARLFPSLSPEVSEAITDKMAVKTLVEPDRRFTPEDVAAFPKPALPPPRRRSSSSERNRRARAASRRRWRGLSLAAGVCVLLGVGLVTLAEKQTTPSSLTVLMELLLPARVEAAPLPASTDDEPGQLTITTEAPTDVYVSNRKMGTTPMAALRMPPGRQSLRLVNPKAHVDKVVSVEIKPGTSSELRVSW